MKKQNETVLVLRTCNADMTSYNGFKYPRKGIVEAPDWEATYKCGHGLHGLPWGCGRVGYLNLSEDAVWQIIKVNISDGYLTGKDELQDKCKFKKGTVVYTGKRAEAIKYLDKNGAIDKPVVFAQRVGGYRAIVTGGDGAIVTGGDGATVTGGYGAIVTGGDEATVTGGDRATVTGGYRATVTGGYRAIVTGGDGGSIQIKHWDGERYRIKTGYIGEDGLKANMPYCLDGNHNFIEKD